MIAHDGLSMPRDIQLDKKTAQQIHIFGKATFCRDGRTLTLFRHDLNDPRIERKHSKVERSLCD